MMRMLLMDFLKLTKDKYLQNDQIMKVPGRKYDRLSRFLRVLIALTVFFHAYVSAQNDDPTELSIKTSGLYFYGQAIGDNEEIAVIEARQELVANIVFSSQDKFDSQLQTDVLLQDVKYQYLVFPRGNRIRALAYLLKERVIWDAKKEKLKIGEAVFAEQESQQNPSTDDQEDLQTEQVKSISTENIEFEETIINNDEAITTKPDVDEGSDNDNNQDVEQVMDAKIVKSPTPEIISSESDLIHFVQGCENVNELAPILTDMKVNGLIQFGDQRSMSNPNSYYLLYFDPNTGQLTGFLDKPKNEVRYDLINKTQIQDLSHYKKSKLIWILFF